MYFMFALLCLGLLHPLYATCEIYLNQQERILGIPRNLLRAISHTESGRVVGKTRQAWPWTINVNGQGYVFDTKEEAIEAVKSFQRRGMTSIDVGCMQINLKFHPHAFKTLIDAFDPQLNVIYAGEYLQTLKIRYGSWFQAVGHYHSSSPFFHGPYRERVIKAWEYFRRREGVHMPVLQDVNFVSSGQTPLHQTPMPTYEGVVRFTPYYDVYLADGEPHNLRPKHGFVRLAHKIAQKPQIKVKRHYIQLSITPSSSGFMAIR
jgi:hypothetical protein